MTRNLQLNFTTTTRLGVILLTETQHCIWSQLGHWLDMVYLPPRGNFVDHIFLEAQCLARILQHVSPLTMAALSCNRLLHTLPYKIFDN